MMYGYGYGAGAGCGASAGYGVGPCGSPIAAPVAQAAPGRGFALIVVLFILLVIIGASWTKPVC